MQAATEMKVEIDESLRSTLVCHIFGCNFRPDMWACISETPMEGAAIDACWLNFADTIGSTIDSARSSPVTVARSEVDSEIMTSFTGDTPNIFAETLERKNQFSDENLTPIDVEALKQEFKSHHGQVSREVASENKLNSTYVKGLKQQFMQVSDIPIEFVYFQLSVLFCFLFFVFFRRYVSIHGLGLTKSRFLFATVRRKSWFSCLFRFKKI
jgi:hypothetical protein